LELLLSVSVAVNVVVEVVVRFQVVAVVVVVADPGHNHLLSRSNFIFVVAPASFFFAAAVASPPPLSPSKGESFVASSQRRSNGQLPKKGNHQTSPLTPSPIPP
jgi:hypothetical protein